MVKACLGAIALLIFFWVCAVSGDRSPVRIVAGSSQGALDELLGLDAGSTARVLASRDYRFAHEAGVWLPSSGEVLFTSHQEAQPDGSVAALPYAVSLVTGRVRSLAFGPNDVLNPAGGTAAGDGRVLIASMGRGTTPGRLQFLTIAPPHREALGVAVDVATWHSCPRPKTGRCAFNSPNDITLSADGRHAWFTDPLYGQPLGYVNIDALNNTKTPAVYHLDMRTGKVTNALQSCCLGLAPNGIALSPDGTALYMTSFNAVGTVFKMDVTYGNKRDSDDEPPLLSNFGEFYRPHGFWKAPDGIKVDVLGNLFLGCSDGVHVLSPDGEFLGRIAVPGGVANLVFGGDEYRTLIMLNERRIITMKTNTQGAVRND